jgi:outer membrane protein assembly factor BamB
VLGSDGDLACLEAKSGKNRWQKNIRKEFGGQPHDWAYAESPLVDGDVVVVTPGESVGLFNFAGASGYFFGAPEQFFRSDC